MLWMPYKGRKCMLIGAPKMIVSGLARYDAFGRVKEAFYPVVEDLTNKANFNTAFDNSQIGRAHV